MNTWFMFSPCAPWVTGGDRSSGRLLWRHSGGQLSHLRQQESVDGYVVLPLLNQPNRHRISKSAALCFFDITYNEKKGLWVDAVCVCWTEARIHRLWRAAKETEVVLHISSTIYFVHEVGGGSTVCDQPCCTVTIPLLMRFKPLHCLLSSLNLFSQRELSPTHAVVFMWCHGWPCLYPLF